jgi:hypothetical protein
MQFTLNGLLRPALKKIVERLLNIASKWIKCKKLLALLLLFYCHGIYSRMNTCTFTYIDLIEVSFALFVLFWGIFAVYIFFTDCQLTNISYHSHIFEHCIYGLNMINASISILLFYFTSRTFLCFFLQFLLFSWSNFFFGGFLSHL